MSDSLEEQVRVLTDEVVGLRRKIQGLRIFAILLGCAMIVGFVLLGGLWIQPDFSVVFSRFNVLGAGD